VDTCACYSVHFFFQHHVYGLTFEGHQPARSGNRPANSGFPVHGVLPEVSIDCGADGRMESVSPDLIEQPETLQLVLNRIFHFRELQLDPRRAQGLLELAKHVGREVTSTLVRGSAVTTTRRTGVGELATASNTRV